MAIVSLLFIVVYVSSVIGIGYFIFSPFQPVVSNPPAAGARFQITDLLALFFPIQFGFAVLHFFFPDIDWNVSVAVAVTIVLLVITALTWFYGMRLLWRMDVHSLLKRVVLLGLVMPIGCVISTISLPVVVSGNTVNEMCTRFVIVLCIVLTCRCLAVTVVTKRAVVGQVE